MPKIKLVKKKTNEMSGTGGSASATAGTGAQYATPKAGVKVAADYNKTFGTHFAPSIPNRPSKAIDYKELWESGNYDSLAGILKQLGAEADSIKVLIKAVEMGALKPSDAIIITKKSLGLKEDSDDANAESEATFGHYSDDGDFDWADGQQSSNPLPAEENKLKEGTWKIGSPDDIQQFVAIIQKIKDKYYNIVGDDEVFDGLDTAAHRAEELIKLKAQDNPVINEAKYSDFKKMTQVRTPGEQLHRAIREIRRKIDEINKLVSYTEKMKTEMKSDVNEVNYLKRTKEALAKISARIQETNNKIKRLVQ